jgi:hypothetical protein
MTPPHFKTEFGKGVEAFDFVETTFPKVSGCYSACAQTPGGAAWYSGFQNGAFFEKADQRIQDWRQNERQTPRFSGHRRDHNSCPDAERYRNFACSEC